LNNQSPIENKESVSFEDVGRIDELAGAEEEETLGLKNL